jgi:hypothetical protein
MPNLTLVGNPVGGEGSGNVFDLDAAGVAALSADGTGPHLLGSGSQLDAIVLTGANSVLDLTLIAQISIADPQGARIQSIEHIDLTGTGANTLKLTVEDVIATAQNHHLVVDGNLDDTVIASGWTQTGTMDANGHTYAVYIGSTAADAAQLLIDMNINRTQVVG